MNLQVDAHNIVPARKATTKQEVGARTLRPKIHDKLSEFLVHFPEIESPIDWDPKDRPDTIDWDAEITNVLTRGSHIPEVCNFSVSRTFQLLLVMSMWDCVPNTICLLHFVPVR